MGRYSPYVHCDAEHMYEMGKSCAVKLWHDPWNLTKALS